MDASERGRLLYKLADLVERDRLILAVSMTREQKDWKKKTTSLFLKQDAYMYNMLSPWKIRLSQYLFFICVANEPY